MKILVSLFTLLRRRRAVASPTDAAATRGLVYSDEQNRLLLRVKYIGFLPNLLGGRRDEMLSLHAEASVKDLLNMLIERHGEALKGALFDESGSLRRTAMVLLDGMNIVPLDSWGTKLNGAKEVNIVGAGQVASGG